MGIQWSRKKEVLKWSTLSVSHYGYWFWYRNFLSDTQPYRKLTRNCTWMYSGGCTSCSVAHEANKVWLPGSKITQVFLITGPIGKSFFGPHGIMWQTRKLKLHSLATMSVWLQSPVHLLGGVLLWNGSCPLRGSIKISHQTSFILQKYYQKKQLFPRQLYWCVTFILS